MASKSRTLASMAAVTVIGILAYRIGAHVPLPGIALQVPFDEDFLATASMLSGASLTQATFFGLGVMPYIMAQIVMQVLQTCIPAIKRVAKDGAAGRNRIVQWTRRMTVAFAAVYAVLYLLTANVTIGGIDPLLLKVLDGVILVGGAMALMRIGEIIDEHGLGQGMSVIIAASILSQVPSAVSSAIVANDTKAQVAVAAAMFVVMVPVVVWMERTVKNIKLARASATVATKVDHYLPVRLIVAGVVPVIFASMLRSLPTFVMGFLPITDVNLYFSVYAFMNGWPGLTIEAALIVLFSFAYIVIAFDCDEIAENLAKNGAYIAEAHVRPGRETAAYIRRVVLQVTVPGAFLLTVVALMPGVITMLTGNALVGAIGGTSLIIVADTVMRIADQVRAERLVAKH